MKIRFYTTNKEAIVFDLEDILKQLNIKEQVATVGLVVEKDEAEVEAITQTIQDDYPNMYLQAKEYGRNLTLACAELPNPTNPDIVTYLYAGDDATETDSWIAKVNNTIRAQGDNYKYQSASNILTARTKAERNYIVRLIKMYCDDSELLGN